jgi:hypothetical protein
MKKFFAIFFVTALFVAFTALSDAAAYTLTVSSYNPSSGVAITVSPNDTQGRNNGTTQFTRSYNNGTVVSLTAPAGLTGKKFQKWRKSSTDYSTNRAITVTVNASFTMTAYYLSDTTAPTTSASPVGGTFTGPVTVTLTPNETATTYYCTGSSSCNPTTVYTAPVAISASTTLRYYSKDVANNSETVKSQTYTITASPHASIQSYDGPQTCIACHQAQANEMLSSLHMQWSGPTPNVTNANGQTLGKAIGGINTFCTYAMTSGGACFNCHLRLDGNAPHAPSVNDIDCLMCHNDTYQRKLVADPNNSVTVTNVLGQIKTYLFGLIDGDGNYSIVPDYNAMPIGTTMVSLAQNVHKPTRKSCLRCHAKAGGGDWTKRGDMGVNTAAPTVAQDVHMSPDAGGANLTCSSCHKTDAAKPHLVGGRGIDLRQTEAATPKCTTCHTTNPHGSTYTPTSRTGTPSDAYIRDRHGNEGVGCMTCHIDAYGKGGATEMSRDWLTPVWNPAFCNGQGGFVGHEVKQSNVLPEYVLFNGTSYVYSIGDQAVDLNGNGIVDMAKANGKLFDGVTKVVPIKRHFSVMPVNNSTNEIIPPQINWMFMTGYFDEAVQRGMQDFGYIGPYTMKTVEAEMLIAHGVAPKTSAKTCTTCHDLSGETPDTYGPVKYNALGYHVWPAKVKSCTLCHSSENLSWKDMHNKHAEEMGKGCVGCHTTEPTGWKEPPTPSGLCNNCHSGRSYSSAQSLHKEHAESEHGSMHTTCTDCHTF